MNLNNYLKKLELKKPHPIIFISGLGGSGKTTLAKKLTEENSNARYFTLDWYHINTSSERARRTKEAINSGNPDLMEKELNPINWFDYKSFKKDLIKFQKTGKFHKKNIWDQQSGELENEYTLDFMNKKGLIICDGLYLLHSPIENLADFSILIDLSIEEARRRAIQRDGKSRTEEYLARKRMIAKKYDLPYFKKYKKNADLVLDEIK